MLKRFVCALQFLTRLPVGFKPNITQNDFARSMAFFPVVGVIVGCCLWLSYWLLGDMLIPEVIAAIILMVGIAITGALHLDGFMDTMDGLFCGRTRERRLEILRDSRVGAHSVVSVVMLTLLKWALLLQLFQDGAMILPALLLMPVYGRLNMVLATFFFPYVREEGLGKAFSQSLRRVDISFAILFTAAFTGALLSWVGLAVGVVVIGTAMLSAAAITRLLGGLTGDVYGWINEISEVVWLFLLLLMLS
ncbi:adenosylcobinamide-GDP ribazoletransferase [Metallumcola ferriviriculae]|uniref:Adenosylcobinamide-GDP ribazoletransferase n=1 Tax=Metallumcola ferriviriculae TaxID=3039180 RepID=A0AAU0UNP1_9FIRM|nr:adenosylcobinamide-GDP ribazoletransferase [Desulfitibacteraceae bacterium MK1]